MPPFPSYIFSQMGIWEKGMFGLDPPEAYQVQKVVILPKIMSQTSENMWVRSARQNRKPQTLLSPWRYVFNNIQSNCLCEKYGIQLRGSCIPGEHKTTIKAHNLTHTYTLVPAREDWEETPNFQFLPGEGKKLNIFQWGGRYYPRNWFLSCLNLSTDRNRVPCWGPLRTKAINLLWSRSKVCNIRDRHKVELQYHGLLQHKWEVTV